MGVSAGRAGGWLFVCALTMPILLVFLCPLCPQPQPPPTDSIRDANPAETADPAADPAVADVHALAAGDATVEAKIPGLAARSGFLFIKALGQVGFYADGAINWDIAILVAGFGVTLFISQLLSGMGMPANPQQSTANKITPVMITGMFLFFPLPAGVLLYMLIANIFQGLQTFILTKEALPDNLQKILDQQMAQKTVTVSASSGGSRLPFEPNGK